MTNRTKVYVDGPHGTRVPATEIRLTNGESLRLYDTSGPGSDPARGLAPLRRDWITGRADVEPYQGRSTQLRDDGRAAVRRGADAPSAFVRTDEHQPRKAKAGHKVTQMHYAKRREI